MDLGTVISWLSNADLGTIPAENIVLVSALLSAYIAYQTRKNGLETDRERERYLNSRLQDTARFSHVWGVKIGNILVNEDSGLIYRLRKFFFGSISGSTTISVTYKNITIEGSFWEQDRVQELVDRYEVEVEHIHTQEHLDPTAATFQIDSVDYEDIVGFFNYIIEFDKYVNGLLPP